MPDVSILIILILLLFLLGVFRIGRILGRNIGKLAGLGLSLGCLRVGRCFLVGGALGVWGEVSAI